MSNPPPPHVPPPHRPEGPTGSGAPTLPYAVPEKVVRNGVGWFLLRMLLGSIMGGGSIVAGAYLAAYTNVALLILVPPAAALGVAIWLCAGQKRFGYLTGVILAPFIIGAGLVVLLLIMCGGLGK
jgi:hypothetical protein